MVMFTVGVSNGSVHFLDSNGHLKLLADNFTSYLRLMILYMGLPDWSLVHLGMEVTQWSKVIFILSIFL